ncbi:MAG: hypothetical protein KDH19_01070 [Geminicoccaceae bacterium]|nr:hypothetical protein [Geminicoccaceae bacterium]
MRTLPAILFSLTLLHAIPAPAGENLPGYDRLDIRAGHRAGLVEGSLWYPAGSTTYQSMIGDDAAFSGTPALVGPTIASGKYPLFLLSHGSGGNMDNLSWLSSALVEGGAMVLAVNHQGSTSGDSSPRRSIHVEDRAADLSAALDRLLADEAFAVHVDRERIYALGFSLGGATAFHLGGLRMDRTLYADWCRTPGERATDCRFFESGGVDPSNLHEGFENDLRDTRIKGVVAIDPGLTRGMSEASIDTLDLPVLILQLGEDESLWPAIDTGPNGSRLAERLSRARRVSIPDAHHFSFLGLCKEGAQALLEAVDEDPICTDPEGADRSTTHDRISGTILSWIRER